MSARSTALVGFLLVACAGKALRTSEDPPAPAAELDVLEHMGIPRAFAGQLFSQLPAGQSLPARIVLSRPDGTPAAGESFLLRWDDGAEEVETDRKGVAHVALTADRRRNPHLLVPAGYTAAPGRNRISVVTGSDPGASLESIDLTEFDSFSAEGLEVFYPAGAADDARDVLAELERIRNFAVEFAGLDLGALDYGVVLVDGPERGLTLEGRFVIPIMLDAWRRRAGSAEFTRWPIVHEWVEFSLIAEGLYVSDSALRMAGDGVAEFVSYSYCRRHAPWEVPGRVDIYLRRVDALLANDHERYDFAASFLASVSTTRTEEPHLAGTQRANEAGSRDEMVAGYAVSFWFWRTLHAYAGAESMGELIHWLDETDSPSAKQLIDKAVASTGARLSATPALSIVRKDLQVLRDSLD